MDNSAEKPLLSEVIVKKSRSTVYAKKQKEFTGKPCSQNQNQVVSVKIEPGLHVGSKNTESFKGKGTLKEVPVNAKQKQKEFTGKPYSQNRNQEVGVKIEPGLHVGSKNTESFKGKGALKEVSVNAFGVGIKRRRNGSNALRVKPNVPGSKPDKEGSSGQSGSTGSDYSESKIEVSVPQEEKPSCLGDVVKNKSVRRTPQKGKGLQKRGPNSSSGATSSRLLGQKRKQRPKYSKEIEEVDLEENAARMLCSLSDQRSGLNISKPINGVNAFSSVQGSNESAGPSQVLRPRRYEGFVRKRRCFYEVNLRDFNPFSIVKWRIRVYWPLDRSWYVGSVKEYDPVIRKHRVRYDDQEEEWLDLHNERFKLLLYPSDVPNKSKWNENKNPNLMSRENIKEEREEDSEATLDSSGETEPTRSLLACSSYQPKPIQLPVISNSNNSEIKANKSPSKNGRFFFVYSRRRLRNSKQNLSSISILASAADTTLANVTSILPSHHDITLKLNLPLELFAGQVLTWSYFWHWHSLFFLYHGALITISPVVRLEITVSDDSFGSRYFLLEVCLRSAVSLFCFLAKMFGKGNKCSGEQSELPVTSISYTISVLHGYKGQVVLGLFSFFRISNWSWDYFQKTIKRMKMEDSPSGLVDQLLVYQPTFSGVNPMIFFMNKRSTSKLPSLLSSHQEMTPVFDASQNPVPTTVVYVSGDKHKKDASSTNITCTDEKSAKPFSRTTSTVEVPIDQISHVVALPATVQRTNALIHSSTPTAPRSTPHRARTSSLLKLWPSSDPTVHKRSFSDNSSRQWPVEPVSKSRSNNQKIPQSSKSLPRTHSEYGLTCYANVLVTADSRGWRECGAHVVIDFDEQEGARLCVQLFNEVKYFHRANQVMQLGTTNRYTHAMMWRGERDWSLEFTDRTQWFIFKQMYRECYNRNMRAASVKNIPTPGVRMVESENMVGLRKPFVRGPRYIRQVWSDKDLALDPSRVMYDMDSEDEDWVAGFNGERELTEDLFEQVMDKCEKLAYMNQCMEFTAEQIEEVMQDMGPMEVVKEVTSYWSTKRKKKGMPLIRQLQPPLWMHYQKQLEEWEASARRILRATHSALSKAHPAEKPPMFAFCLRPRGLKPKQHRPQKKMLLSSRSHKSGKRPSATTSRERVASISRLSLPNRSGISVSPFSDNHQAEPSVCQQTVSTRKRVHPTSSDMSERTVPIRMPSDNHWFLKEDVDEFKLRDASNAAVHAANMARLKREKAELLMQKADLAMYKARVALMIADAVKSSKGTTGGAT